MLPSAAEWRSGQRVGLMTQRSLDQNQALLFFLPLLQNGAHYGTSGHARRYDLEAGANMAMGAGCVNLVLNVGGRNKSMTVSEWPRRWIRNPLGSARRGSNPLAVGCLAATLCCLGERKKGGQ